MSAAEDFGPFGDVAPRAEPRPRRRAELGDADRGGLCPRCRHLRVVVGRGGSRFLRCGLARVRPGFAKYPAQPVLSCPGWER